uniref:Peptidase M13 N-terminal domain-containing protein n=1 Tax=Timema genevievae TaxID=629358 RepID=A0A7R9JMX5_TIMGE|nr:unnamed protein product [Timema genevievae]
MRACVFTHDVKCEDCSYTPPHHPTACEKRNQAPPSPVVAHTRHQIVTLCELREGGEVIADNTCLPTPLEYLLPVDGALSWIEAKSLYSRQLACAANRRGYLNSKVSADVWGNWFDLSLSHEVSVLNQHYILPSYPIRLPVAKILVCSHSTMIPKMNSSAAPCEDMWNYACGNWLKRHLVPVTQSKWGTTQELQAKYREQLRSLIVTLPHPVKLSSVTWKLKHFYESCMALDNLETDKDQPLHRIINELGGWNVLREFSHFSWDYRVNLVKLHSQYGVSPFFKISVVPDPDNPERGVIKVSPAGLGLPDRSYYYRRPDSQVEASYKRYLKDAVQKLGATSTEAATFSEEIYHFEKRIAEVTPEWSALQNPLTSYTKISIGEFENKASSIPLHDIIMAKYPTAKIDDTTEVLIPSDNYLTHISSIITTSDRGNLNNYMMWNFAMAYLPYLSQDYRDIVNLYRKELTGIQEPPQRWEICVDTTQKYLGFSLAALHERGVPFDTRQEDQAVVNSMFENIKDAAKNSIQKSGWLDSKLQQYTLEKRLVCESGQLGTTIWARPTGRQTNWAPDQLGARPTGRQANWAPGQLGAKTPSCLGAQLSLRPVRARPVGRARLAAPRWRRPVVLDRLLNSLALQVGYPPSIQAELYLDSYYKEMYVQKNNFFQNILYGVAFLQATEMSKLLAPAEEHRWIAVMAGVDAVSYIPEANKVVVPYRLLMSPFFHRHYPLSILYGTLGMQVASAVVSSILPWNVLLNPSGRLLSQDNPIVNQSLRAARWPRRFIAERIVKNQATEHVANQTALQTVIDISALKQAYNLANAPVVLSQTTKDGEIEVRISALVQAVNRLPHTHQPALEQLENDALFFLSYAQTSKKQTLNLTGVSLRSFYQLESFNTGLR